MSLIEWFQSLATNFLTMMATAFEFFGTPTFFVFVFALFFLIYDKEIAYKYFLAYSAGFVFGSLCLKNIIARQRPYDANNALLSTRSSYSYSLPSGKGMLVAEAASFYYFERKKYLNKKSLKGLLFAVLTIFVVLTSLTQLYFANNYLLDIIIGIALGLVISYIIYRFVQIGERVVRYTFCVFLPILVVLLICYLIFWNNFGNVLVFDFLGIGLSVLIGYYIEHKKIKYEGKNNLFSVVFKSLIVLIVLATYFLVWKLVLAESLPASPVIGFFKYFIIGFVVTLLLPVVFKKLDRFFYCFSTAVNEKDIISSSISLSLRDTKKIAKKFSKSLKPGDVVLLSGDLGAGKSVLVRNILEAVGVTKKITSPTFTIVNEYPLGNFKYYHLDLYRIENDEEVFNIGFEEIIDAPAAVKFIEWPEKLQNYKFNHYKKITIVKLGKRSRNIIVEEKA